MSEAERSSGDRTVCGECRSPAGAPEGGYGGNWSGEEVCGLPVPVGAEFADIFPSEEDFMALSRRYGLVQVARKLPLGDLSPLLLFGRLRDEEPSPWAFLLESGDRGNRGGRYSFVGTRPLRTYRVLSRGEVAVGGEGGDETPVRGDLLRILEADMEDLHPAPVRGLPPFSGGAVGFFGYEMIEEWEELFHDRPGTELPRPGTPAAMLMIPGSVAAVDHVERSLVLVENIPVGNCGDGERRERYRAAGRRLTAGWIAEPTAPGGGRAGGMGPAATTASHPRFRPEIPRERFLEEVRSAKEHIRNGQACQIVLSQRFVAETPDLPVGTLYSALKEENPSPYMFLLDFPGLALVGSSPEVLIRVEGRKVISRPLAGTRRRDAALMEDLALEEELIADGKELAEHAMLVDLARNDLARVCLPESVLVTEYLQVERYARVMHLGSQVEGLLAPGRGALAAFRSAFPAGTVSGAPKIRAAEIIAELEGMPRGAYAGAVGYLDFRGNLDTCIAIRTFEISEGRIGLRAGAGIVADSEPEREYEETINKARALFAALERATGTPPPGKREGGAGA